MPVITSMWAADPLGTAGMNYGAFKYIFGNFKVVPVHAVKAEVQLNPFLPRHWMEVSGQTHVSAAFPPEKYPSAQ